jgi:hypothetical protein
MSKLTTRLDKVQAAEREIERRDIIKIPFNDKRVPAKKQQSILTSNSKRDEPAAAGKEEVFLKSVEVSKKKIAKVKGGKVPVSEDAPG